MRKILGLLLIALLSGISDTYAITRNDSFDDRFFLNGLDGAIITSTVHNVTLYAGGTFTWLDGRTRLNFVAQWDGTTLKPVGEGFNGIVRTLSSIDGFLYAGGDFTRSGEVTVNRIARFNEQTRSWEPVGEGFNNTVRALTGYNGDIVAGGYFSNSGEEPVNYVARWNGETWQPMGEGFNSWVLVLKEFEDTLVAGGRFQWSGEQSIYRMARWDGESWQSMDQGLGEPGTIAAITLQTSIQSLSMYNGELVAGGNFWLTDDNGNILDDTQGVARWDGDHWRPFGSGLSHSTGLDGYPVLSLLDLEGKLYAAGSFNESGDTPLNYIARWQDSTWVNVGDGFDTRVSTLSNKKGQLVAGGNFNYSGGVPAHRLAKLGNDDNWLPMIEPGTDGKAPYGFVHSLLYHDGFLYTGGGFQKVGDLPANRIARWDGNHWEPLGEGSSSGVGVLHYHEGNLYAGGSFTGSGDQVIKSIARWDGDSWHALDNGLSDPFGEGIGPSISDMASFGDTLAVAGYFAVSVDDGIPYPAENIALWDGVKWNRPASQVPFRTASSVVEFQGNLIAGGHTSSHNEESVFRLNIEEDEWETMGEQFASVSVLTVYNEQLYAAGRYREENDEVRNRIARWDEDHWKPIDGVFNSHIRELYVHEGQLYAAGHFTEIDGEPAERIARWNGFLWERFDIRINNSVRTLVYVGEDMYLGGAFNTINDQVSHNLARWINVPTPVNNSEDEDRYPGELPEKFRLLPSYPNPFNPVTTIRWEQPEPGKVRLTVYDITGRRVATLIDEIRSAGHHEIQFDAGNLSSGWYFYRMEMETQEHLLHGKMILIK